MVLFFDLSRTHLDIVMSKAGHEPSRAEFGPSLDLARHERAMLGSARWLNEPASGGSAHLAYGSVQPEQLVLPLEAGYVGVRTHQARLELDDVEWSTTETCRFGEVGRLVRRTQVASLCSS